MAKTGGKTPCYASGKTLAKLLTYFITLRTKIHINVFKPITQTN